MSAPIQATMIQVAPTEETAGAAGAVVPDEEAYEPYEPLPDLRFNVADPFQQGCQFLACPCRGIQSKTLLLTDQEVTLKTKDLCGVNKQKRPYAQLGSVDTHANPCGCVTLVSDFDPLNEKGEGGMQIGCCGSDKETVNRIAGELQARKGKRGGIAQIKKLDYVIEKMAKIGVQVPMLLNSMGVDFAKKAAPNPDKEKLTVKTFDVTNNIEILCCTKRTLFLNEEEAELNVANCCTNIKSKREYGQLGFVEKRKNCICCFTLASDISPIPGQSDMAPGCPCTNRAKVTMLVRELRERMATRGQVGQMRKQERILGMVADVEDNMKLLCQKQSVQYPPPQAEMKAQFGDNVPLLGADRLPIETCEIKTHDVTSKCDSICTCCCTCGCAGCTTESMELKEDDMYIKTKNRLDDSDVKIPYAELDSVDMARTNCCFYAIIDQAPGWGCDKAKVLEIAADLQERKYKRGNIAQLKQLRSMQASAAGNDVMADLMIKHQGMQYPPTPEVMTEIFKGKLPRALSCEQKPHFEVEKAFETKTYDVTNTPSSIHQFCCCPCVGCTRVTLELGPEEMFLKTKNCCMETQERTPYGNMGSVETETSMCCLTELPDIGMPGCGCSKALVNEIAAELQERKVMRGNIAQMKQQENIIIEILNMEAKMDMLMHKRSLVYPPSHEEMLKLFSDDPLHHI